MTILIILLTIIDYAYIIIYSRIPMDFRNNCDLQFKIHKMYNIVTKYEKSYACAGHGSRSVGVFERWRPYVTQGRGVVGLH